MLHAVRERVTSTKQFCLSVLCTVPLLYTDVLAEHASIGKIVTCLHETGTKLSRGDFVSVIIVFILNVYMRPEQKLF